jgi:demethylmenaquinone methyltransferase/2-methoxy-6-polyprenyl-1,4-benzoquinol methylase
MSKTYRVDQRAWCNAERPELDRKSHARKLFAPLPRHYDRVATLLSFGQDPRWRQAMVAAIDAGPQERVLDVATGTGLVARELVRRYGCSVVGLDQSPEMLAAARRRLERDGTLARRVTLVEGEAERLPFGDREFDHLTFTYLLRYVDDVAATLAELARVVRPGGRIGMVEFGVPSQPVLRALWRAHTRVGLPVIGRVLSPAWLEVGRFLGPNVEQFHAAEPDLPSRWREAGIDHVHARPMSFGAGLVMSGVRRG